MIWYVNDLRRSKAERTALESLANTVDWYKPIGWRVDNRLRLIQDCEVVAGGRNYLLYIRYPESFPNSPPSIFPTDTEASLSGHQYGRGGELCLEIRADNWTPDLMGYQMIESAHRLLSGENPAPNERAVVASAHETTLGQELRSETRRLTISRLALAILRRLREGESVKAQAQMLDRETAYLYVVDALQVPDDKFIDPTVPRILAGEGAALDTVFTRVKTGATLPPVTTLDAFSEGCASIGAESAAALVVILRGDRLFAYRVLTKAASVHHVGIVQLPKAKRRLAEDHGILSSKSVGLVGCGSLGSKIATSLARSGVGKFLLVDDDILTPDNFVRNELDWRDVGLNKADAVATKVQLVNPVVNVRARRIRLGGQEAAESADDVLISLAACDIVVDATANPAALNVIAGISQTAKRPVVWAEVFGGGIGGIIARHRPGIEPSLSFMRRAIENWFAEQGAEPIRVGADYDQLGDENPLIADDADVSAIAAPTTRLIIDCLLARQPSYFPYSVYTIGLAPGSVFRQAFETFPIEMGNVPDEEPAEDLPVEEAQEEMKSIVALILKSTDEASSDGNDN